MLRLFIPPYHQSARNWLTRPKSLPNDHQAPVALTKEDADAMTARGAAVNMYDREHNDPLAGVFAAKAVIGEATHHKS